MIGPHVSPLAGVTRYVYDRTQGPACALSCPAGTIYRNYLVPVPAGGDSNSDNNSDSNSDSTDQITPGTGQTTRRVHQEADSSKPGEEKLVGTTKTAPSGSDGKTAVITKGGTAGGTQLGQTTQRGQTEDKQLDLLAQTKVVVSRLAARHIQEQEKQKQEEQGGGTGASLSSWRKYAQEVNHPSALLRVS